MPINVRAAVAHLSGQPMTIETVQLNGPGEGEVLVEMKAAGLCHSDLHVLDGHLARPFPIVLGHEGAGVVVECGQGVTSLRPGDHVVGCVVPECRQCNPCTSGRGNLCDELTIPPSTPPTRPTLNGAALNTMSRLGTFAEYAVIRETSLAKVREDAPLDVLCYIGCGVMTGLGAVLTTADVRPGASVVVFGLGGVGLNAVQAARLAGAVTIIGVDTNDSKEAVARNFGATHFLNPKTLDGTLQEYVFDVTRGGADFSFECVGSTALQRQALECVHPGWGLCTFVGIAPDGQEMSFPPSLMMRGRRIAGSLMGGMRARSSLPRLVDWYMENKINVDDLISHRLLLPQINEGFDLMRNGDGVRSIILFDT